MFLLKYNLQLKTIHVHCIDVYIYIIDNHAGVPWLEYVNVYCVVEVENISYSISCSKRIQYSY